MSKNIKIAIGIILIFSMLVIGIMDYSSRTLQEKISKIIDVDCEKAEIVFEVDTHGGFHNDGTHFVQLEFDNDEFVKKIKANNSWHVLPADDLINELIYGVSYENRVVGPYISDENINPYFPNVDNGYYFFLDKEPNKKSFNVIVAIYDIDTNTLYYCELDT